MDLSTNKIPNKMLLGTEVLEIAVAEFREMMKRDHMFLHTIAYQRVAFTLQATFHFGYPLPADHLLRSRTKKDGVLEGEAPLKDLPDEDGTLIALERDVTLDNPNIARVHHDLPIIVQEKMPPKPLPQSNLPDEPSIPNPFPEIVDHELRYDKTQFPKGPEPVDRDVSEQKAKELGVRRRK